MTHFHENGRLLFLVSRAHHNLADRVFGQIGLSRGQAPVLFELRHQDGLNQSTLAEKMELTQATMTNLLHRMEKSGLINRMRDSKDNRYTRVYLTPHGKEILDRAFDLAYQMEDISFAGFSNEEQIIIQSYLERLHANMVQGQK